MAALTTARMPLRSLALAARIYNAFASRNADNNSNGYRLWLTGDGEGADWWIAYDYRLMVWWPTTLNISATIERPVTTHHLALVPPKVLPATLTGRRTDEATLRSTTVGYNLNQVQVETPRLNLSWRQPMPGILVPKVPEPPQPLGEANLAVLSWKVMKVLDPFRPSRLVTSPDGTQMRFWDEHQRFAGIVALDRTSRDPRP